MQAIYELSREFANSTDRIATGVRRAAAVLRLMQHRFMHGGQPVGADECDVEALVDICLAELPDKDQDIYDPMDDFDTRFRKAVMTEAERGERLSKIAEALAVAARADSSCDELTKAASTVYEIFREDAAYEPHWRSFVAAMNSRGYLVENVEIGGLDLGPSVMTPEMKKRQRKADRRMKNFSKAVQGLAEESWRRPDACQTAL